MNADLLLDGPDGIDFAVALLRTPERFPSLLRGHGSLPDGVTEVLRLAWDAARHGCVGPLDERRRAALFFADRVLLAPDADHYRVLGVTRDADPVLVRAHYRLMIGIYHPDRRGGVDGERATPGARVTTAYGVLRDLRARIDYDRRVGRPTVATAAGFPPAAAGPVVDTSDPDEAADVSVHARRIAPRTLPRLVLGAVALGGVLLVAAMYFTRPVATVGLAQTQPATEPANAADSHEIRVQDASANGDAASAVSGGQAAHAGLEPIGSAQASPTAVEPRGRTEDVRGGRAVPQVRMPAAAAPPSAERLVPPPAGPAGDEGAVAGHGAIGMPGMVGAPAPAEAPIRVREGQLLLQRFSAAYQRGDIDDLMALFAEGARSTSGERMQTRRDYEALFRDSRARQLDVADMRWTVGHDVLLGRGGYLARVWPAQGGAELVQSGSLRFELTRQGDTMLISGLFHDPAR